MWEEKGVAEDEGEAVSVALSPPRREGVGTAVVDGQGEGLVVGLAVALALEVPVSLEVPLTVAVPLWEISPLEVEEGQEVVVAEPVPPPPPPPSAAEVEEEQGLVVEVPLSLG